MKTRRLGRKENDLKWNYGVQISDSPYCLDGWVLCIWIFKQKELTEKYAMLTTNKKGFLLDIEIGYSGRIISFRVPRIRSKII